MQGGNPVTLEQLIREDYAPLRPQQPGHDQCWTISPSEFQSKADFQPFIDLHQQMIYNTASILQDKLCNLGVAKPGINLATQLRTWFLANSSLQQVDRSKEDLFRLLVTYTMCIKGWNPPDFQLIHKKYKGPVQVPLPLIIMHIWFLTAEYGQDILPDEINGEEFNPVDLLPMPMFPGDVFDVDATPVPVQHLALPPVPDTHSEALSQAQPAHLAAIQGGKSGLPKGKDTHSQPDAHLQAITQQQDTLKAVLLQAIQQISDNQLEQKQEILELKKSRSIYDPPQTTVPPDQSLYGRLQALHTPARASTSNDPVEARGQQLEVQNQFNLDMLQVDMTSPTGKR